MNLEHELITVSFCAFVVFLFVKLYCQKTTLYTRCSTAVKIRFTQDIEISAKPRALLLSNSQTTYNQEKSPGHSTS
jgi:hypothetical protein